VAVLQQLPTRAKVGERAVDERRAPARPLLATDNGRDVGQAVAMVVARGPLSLGTLHATSGCHAMDMTFWLPQAEAALAQVEGR
jgi:hypothetical protein